MNVRWFVVILAACCALLAFVPPVRWFCASALFSAIDAWGRRDLPYDPDPIPFDSAAWRASHPGLRSPRLAMVDDLVHGGVLMGKTRSETESILGPDDPHASAPTPKAQARLRGWDLRFSAGARDLSPGWFDPWSCDFTWVVVRFGPGGRVVEVGRVDDR